MIKRILLFVLLLSSLNFYAQERGRTGLASLTNNFKQLQSNISSIEGSGHLTFKGIPIDGSPVEFMKSLGSKGFVVSSANSDEVILVGRFANHDDAHLTVCSDGNLVYSVIVTFPAHENWSSMLDEYRLFKSSYETKYGVHPNSIERFPAHIPEGTGREHNAFREGSAIYRSSFGVAGGIITMAIAPAMDGKGKFCLKIEYKDERNASIHASAFMNDL